MFNYSKEDTKKVISIALEKLKTTGFFHVFGSSVINKILGFLSGIAVVRIINKFDFGIYSFALNKINIVLLLSGIGMAFSVFQISSEHAEDDDFQEALYGYATRTGYLFNILLTLIIIIYALFSDFQYQAIITYLLFMCLYPFATLMFQFQQSYLRSRLLAKEFSYSNTINSSCIVTFSIVGALLKGVTGLIIGTYLAYIISSIIIWKKFKAPIITQKKLSSHNAKKDLWKIALVATVNNGLSQLVNYIDVLFIGIYIMDPTVLASYKVATTIPLALSFIPSCVITYVYPYFAKNRWNKEWSLNMYFKMVKYLALLNLFIMLTLIATSKLIIPLIFGSQYLDSVKYYNILLIGYFFYGTFKCISGNLLVTQRKLGINFVGGIISLFICVFGNMLLLPRIGALGSAIINTSSNIIIGFISTIFYIKTLKNIKK